jgi:predicted nuclease with RNAse H fold
MTNGVYIGIDLGGRDKKTTGLCVLAEKGDIECELVKGKDVLKKIRPYLKNTKVIAIDAPLTKGRGKGNFRLYEKFLSTRTFRQEKINPLPPALMSKFCDFARELRAKLEKRGFVLDINLIEVFPTLTQKLCGKNLFSILKNKKFLPKTENQKSALICAILAFLHANFKTRWLGYKDGFLFLPETTLWEKSWRKKLYQAWQERDRLKYRRLIANIFK